MPRGRKRVCLLCGKPIEDNNDSVPYKGRYAHSACFRVAVKAVHVDKTEKLEEKAEQKAKKKRGRPPKPKAELKDSVTEEQYIQKKLYYDYLRKFLGDKLPVKVYAVTETEKHYHAVKQVEENNKNKDINGMYKNKIIYIDPKRKKCKQIDITSIGEEE